MSFPAGELATPSRIPFREAMELPKHLVPALEELRDRMLGAPEFPLPDSQRERVSDYRLRAAAPDEAAVTATVDAEANVAGDGDGERTRTRERELQLTPQVVVDSPRGHRYFAAWNHVARIFVIWFTDESLEAFRQEVAQADLKGAGPDEESKERKKA